MINAMNFRAKRSARVHDARVVPPDRSQRRGGYKKYIVYTRIVYIAAGL